MNDGRYVALYGGPFDEPKAATIFEETLVMGRWRELGLEHRIDEDANHDGRQ